MITINPVGLAGTALTANQLSLSVNITERIGSQRSCSCSPQYAVSYSNGTPTISGSSVFVPITAIVTITSPSACRGNTRTQMFAETFTAVFQGQTAAPSTVAIVSVGRTSAICKCKASITDSITITIF